jgi:futalosine hydrolase
MSDRARILVVAATARELATPDGWHTLQCGVGPVEAAARTAATIAALRPAAILHVGIAGARRARDVEGDGAAGDGEGGVGEGAVR